MTDQVTTEQLREIERLAKRITAASNFSYFELTDMQMDLHGVATAWAIESMAKELLSRHEKPSSEQ